jgi:hypothetical protein
MLYYSIIYNTIFVTILNVKHKLCVVSGLDNPPKSPKLKILGEHLRQRIGSIFKDPTLHTARNVGTATTKLRRSVSQNSEDLKYRPMMN